MTRQPSRRQLLAATGTAVLGALLTPRAPVQADEQPKPVLRYGLNTSTIRGQKLSLIQEAEIAAKAGYNAIEPWIGELDAYVKGGGSLTDLRKLLADKGLFVANAIGFFDWLVDDDARRTRGLAEARRTMDMLAQLGAKHIAAPPCGADKAPIPTDKAAERYSALLELGAKCGVTPMLEVWGHSKTLGRIEDAAQVATACGKPQACLLLDVFHMHKGGSDFAAVRKLKSTMLPVFHLNDYPPAPTPAALNDAARLYPGDGVAPLGQLFKDLRAIGFEGVLSLELFNRQYWAQDALTVAKTGLGKMKKAASAEPAPPASTETGTAGPKQEAVIRETTSPVCERAARTAGP